MKEELERFERLVGEDNIHLLSCKSVLIVGVGGVGGYVVESLARSGIGKIILVDFDTVTVSNINRQLIALHSTIGRKKIDVWEERILDINPSCQVIKYDLFYQEDVKDTIFQEKPDFVIDACDTVSSKKLLIMECIQREIPFISCMGTGNRLDPSKLVLTTLDKTSNDPLARILRVWAKKENIKAKIRVLCSKEIPIKTPDHKLGSSAVVPSSAGLLISSYVLSFFLK